MATKQTHATLAMTTIDCADPKAEGEFWAAALGWELVAAEESYALVADGERRLGFGKVEGWRAPGWPNTSGTKQFHLDLAVEDPEAAVEHFVSLGAMRPDHQPGEGWVVLIDPAGHPFCLTRAENWQGS